MANTQTSGTCRSLQMKHSEFRIGEPFWCGGQKWRCTDIGTRTIVAICLSRGEVVKDGVMGPEQHRVLDEAESEAEGWFRGPPYAVAECVFDEYDIRGCPPNEISAGPGNSRSRAPRQ